MTASLALANGIDARIPNLGSDDHATTTTTITKRTLLPYAYTPDHLTKSGEIPVRQSFASSALAQPSRARIPLSAAKPPTPADQAAATDPRLPPFDEAAVAAAAAAAAASAVACASFTASVRFSPASRARRNIGVRPGWEGSKVEPPAEVAASILS